MPSIDDEQYTDIIPTAYLTAYPRTFTDIPFAKEMFQTLEMLRKETYQQEINDELKVKKLAPEIEARYKLVNKLLQQAQVKQILEFASGLSTRGLVMTKNSDITYVEFELEEMATLKKELVPRIATQPSSLHIIQGNALRVEDVDEAAQFFTEPQPLAIIHEGLLRYLNFSEKALIAQNIHKLLERFGGVWITPDITLKKLLATQESHTMPGKNKMLGNITGKNFDENSFANEDEAIKFFEQQGFTIEVHRFREVANELTSPKTLQLSPDETEKINESGRVFVMRIA